MNDVPRPLFDHLGELRRCLLSAIVAWLAAAAACFAYAGPVLQWLIRPPVEKLVFTSPAEPFFAYFKVSFLLASLFVFPWWLYQAWRFLSVALKPKERRLFWELLPVSYSLFLGGIALGLGVVCPTAMRFLLSFATERIVPFLTLNAYLSFVGWVSIGLGLFFQFPVILFVLGGLGVVTPATFNGYRRHVFLGLLIAATFVSAGSVVDQVIIAVPAYALFELTLLAMRLKGYGSRPAVEVVRTRS